MIPLRSPADAPPLPAAQLAIATAFRDGLLGIFGEGLASLYLYGAAAFPRPEGWRLDVDFGVLLREPMSGAQRASARELHDRLARDLPGGDDMDGYYGTMAEASGPRPPFCPLAGRRRPSWALERAHVRADRFHLLHGLDPREVFAAPEAEELRADLAAELRFALGEPRYPHYGILNGCRILRSVREGDVVMSKAAAGEWGRQALPGFAPAIAAALRAYSGREREGDGARLAGAFPGFLDLVRAETGLLALG